MAQSKIRGAVEGYSSWFESSRIDETKLKKVIELDNDLVGVIVRLQSEIGNLDAAKPEFAKAQTAVENLKKRFSKRSELLSRA